MLRKVIKEENINHYDLIYFTQDNAKEDVSYFNELTAHAKLAQYLYLRKQKFDILNHIITYLQINTAIKKTRYTQVLISSFDNLAFKKLTINNKAAKIISFDDGTGHISKYSEYLVEKNKARRALYNFVFGVPASRNFIKRIVRHYSSYRGFENIMPRHIVHFIDIFETPAERQPGTLSIKFFIGHPFECYPDTQYVLNLKKYLEEISCDFYVKHPQESFPLLNTVPILEKNGYIAEDAILKMCGEARPIIVAGFSSVLFNINAAVADKVMVLRRDVEEDLYYADLGMKAGCKIVYV